MPKPQKTKTSLADLLAQRPERPRNDWSNGRPGIASAGRGEDDGFPDYDPKAFESGDEDEEEEDAPPGAGGAFAILAGLDMDAEGDPEDWTTVTAKPKKKAATAGPGPAAAAAAPARRPTVPAAATARPVPPIPTTAPFQRAAALPGAGAGSSSGPIRAPYTINPSAAGTTRTPRAPTHDAEGRPLTDTYYQSFQKVYRNSSGAVCLRFHKTDVVAVQPNGDVVVDSGGYLTRTTFLSVREGLNRIGLELESSLGHEGRGDWSVINSDGTSQPWADGLVVKATSEADRGRGARLLAAYGIAAGSLASGSQAAAPSAGPVQRAPTAPVTATAGAGQAAPSSAGPSMPAPAPAPAPTPTPAPVPAPTPSSTWSYRAAAAPPYAPHLRPAVAPGAAPAAGPAPAPVPTPRTAESILNLKQVLDVALAIQTDVAVPAGGYAAGPSSAAAAGAGAGGPGAPRPAELDDDHACIACMAALKTTLLIPCGHLVMCGRCAEQALERNPVCPMCREPVLHTTVMRV